MLRQAAETTSPVTRLPTALERQLAAPPPPSALEAFRAARRRFLAGERIEMGALATDLGVNRVTLYRWVGNRERLLAEIIWSLAKPTLERADEETTERGAERIIRVSSSFVRAVLGHQRFTAFVHAEPELALRVLTRSDAGMQRRLIEYYEVMLREEVEGGRLSTRIPLHELAYVIIRILESYVYTDLITGEDPDPDKATLVLRQLLR
jgi:AcrR family transcriptional regulator